ncbi:Uncharacterised protein [Vibrio cholerae]|nr:Uncharacterised protein [Vibrio cholerae]
MAIATILPTVCLAVIPCAIRLQDDAHLPTQELAKL